MTDDFRVTGDFTAAFKAVLEEETQRRQVREDRRYRHLEHIATIRYLDSQPRIATPALIDALAAAVIDLLEDE